MSTQIPSNLAPTHPTPGAEETAAAALAICESLLLALNDRKVLPKREILGLLHDAAAVHANDPGDDGREEFHLGVADLINRIIQGGNSARRR